MVVFKWKICFRALEENLIVALGDFEWRKIAKLYKLFEVKRH